jgi:hypothetical protein
MVLLFKSLKTKTAKIAVFCLAMYLDFERLHQLNDVYASLCSASLSSSDTSPDTSDAFPSL